MMVIEQTDASSSSIDRSIEERRTVFLDRALAQFRLASEAEEPMRAAMLEDLRFRASEQWPAEIRNQRELDGRPCLTINLLPQFIRQITNQQRENKPSPIVTPVDSDADVKTAEVYQGLIRHIEQRSKAQVAYNTAGEHQVTMGRGYVRLLTEYETPTSFNQVLVIKRVRNPFMIYMDPACQELDYSDAKFAFVVTDLSQDEYRSRFGKDEPLPTHNFSSTGDAPARWADGDTVRIVEYWYVETVSDVLVQVETGDTILASSIPPALLQTGPTGEPVAILVNGQPVRVVRSRPSEKHSVCEATISGSAVLEGNDDRTAGRVWLTRAKSIPIVPVIGDEIDINGTVDLRGIVRDAKNPQQRYNFWVSAETEIAALAPRAPFVVADGQLEGYTDLWQQANVKNYAFLPYKAQSLEGHLVGPPQRQSASADISSMIAGIQQADNDLKAVTGLYNASLGQSGPEQSGKAILARQRQGQVGSFNYQDNMSLAVATLGRYLVDVIPEVYDAPRIVRILGEDGHDKAVMVHANQPPAQPPVGLAGVFDLDAGLYDVTVNAGPSYESRRQETVAAMTQFAQAYPPMVPMIGDLIARNMDWPGAQQIADRLKKGLPPQFQDDGPDGQPKQPEPPPEMVEQMQQMDQMIQKMSAELDDAKQTLASKQIEAQSAERIAQLNAASREKVAQIQAGSAMAKVQGALEQKNLDLQDSVDIEVARIETDARERIAQLQAKTTLANTELKNDGALDLAAIQAQLADISARLSLASGESHRGEREDG